MAFKLRTTLIIIFSILLISFNGSSTNSYPKEKEKTTVTKKVKKPGFFKKWIQKRIVKKIQKKIQNKEYNQYTEKSKTGLLLGILSFIGLFLGIGIQGGFVLILAGALALAADIICIGVLVKTSNNKEAFKKERKRAITGLVFALLTGLLPIMALIAVLLSF